MATYRKIQVRAINPDYPNAEFSTWGFKQEREITKDGKTTTVVSHSATLVIWEALPAGTYYVNIYKNDAKSENAPTVNVTLTLREDDWAVASTATDPNDLPF